MLRSVSASFRSEAAAAVLKNVGRSDPAKGVPRATVDLQWQDARKQMATRARNRVRPSSERRLLRHTTPPVLASPWHAGHSHETLSSLFHFPTPLRSNKCGGCERAAGRRESQANVRFGAARGRSSRETKAGCESVAHEGVSQKPACRYYCTRCSRAISFCARLSSDSDHSRRALVPLFFSTLAENSTSLATLSRILARV